MSFKAWSSLLKSQRVLDQKTWQIEVEKYCSEVNELLNDNATFVMPEFTHASLAHIKTNEVLLDEVKTQALLSDAIKAYKTDVNDLLVCALVMAFAKHRDESSLYLELECDGRHGLLPFDSKADASRTVGCFTSRFPFLLSLGVTEHSAIGDNIGALVCSVKEQLRAVPSNGFSYSIANESDGMPSLPSPLLLFSYLDQVPASLDVLAQAFDCVSYLEGIHESAVENKISNGLSINAFISQGQLRIKFDWVESLVPFNVDQFATDYINELQVLISHCGDRLKALTPSDFPLATLTQSQLDGVVSQVGIDELENMYGMTSLQEGMLFHSLLANSDEETSAPAYFNQSVVNFDGVFDTQKFNHAWQLIFKRHTVLRTSVCYNGVDEPIQIVHQSCELPITRQDWRDLSTDTQVSKLEKFMDDDRAVGFDFQRPPLMRMALFQLSDKSWKVLWSSHHLILDGWSSMRLIQEVMACYFSLVNNAEPDHHPLLSEKPAPFSDYIAWLQQQNIEQSQQFWQTYLSGFNEPAPIPISRNTSGNLYHRVKLSAELTKDLNEVARKNHVTLNTLMQSAWGLLLSRYVSNNRVSDNSDCDVVFGMATIGRPADLDGVESILGLFLNTLPVRLQFRSDQSLESYLVETQANQIGVREFEHVPLTQIQTWSDVKNGHALFDSLLVVENHLDSDTILQLQQGDERLRLSTEMTHGATNYPLTLFIVPDVNGCIELSFVCNDLQQQEVVNIADYLQFILKEFTESEHSKPLTLNQLAQFSKEDLNQSDVNQTAVEVPALGIEQLFSQQAKIQANSIAARFDEQVLSYGELDAQSNQLAHALIDAGVKPNQLVGICQKRSLSLLVSVLGILKAGAAYVPLDPNYPAERITYMMGDANLSLLLTDQAVLDEGEQQLANASCPVINVSDPGAFSNNKKTAVAARAQMNDLAYVIYTSGSTGQPKGVKITRANLTNFIFGMQEILYLSAQDRLLAVTSLSFDIATMELYLPLICGAEVVIGDELLSMDGSRLNDVISQGAGISVMQATPVTWKLLLNTGFQTSIENQRFTALCGGEAFPIELAKSLVSLPITVWNVYGPTETSVWSSAFELSKSPEAISNTVPIGHPIANTQMYILNDALMPVPQGVAGELYIGGAGVAQGYLGQDELTNERFIDTEYGRIYQTGDLARYRFDGVLECLGRIDNQVKVRGYRIELGEIESTLLQHESVVDAAVNPYDVSGEPVLVAYVVLAKGHELTNEALKQHVGQTLPNYMLPSFVVELEALPLTPNGKVDRKSLPKPDVSTQQQAYVAPTTDTQIVLSEIWQDVLGVERVGINDDFFALGGHSLIAIRLQAKITQRFSVDLSMRDLFEKNSIKDIAKQIERYVAANAINQALLANKNKSDVTVNDDVEEFEL